MFALRRVATKALLQPVRQISTQSPAIRFSPLRLQRPAHARPFHQSWRAFADEEKTTPAEQAEASPAEADGEIGAVTTEPSATEQAAEIKEESIATSEVADAAASTQQDQASDATVVEKAQEFVSSAAEAVQNAADKVVPRDTARAAQDILGSRPVNDGRIIYVGNLYFEVTPDQLKAQFEPYGEIKNIRVVEDARGLSKGFGYVEYAAVESAKEAIEQQNQKEFFGRRLSVQHHIPRGTRPQHRSTATEPTACLFIGNMSFQMSDRDLNDLFREVRNVLDVRVAIDRRTGQPRGFAHADFIDVESAERAREFLQKKIVYGRQLRVDFTSPKPAPQTPRSE